MTTSPSNNFEEQTISKCESIRLKTLAEQTYTSSSSNLPTALKYAKRAHRLCPTLNGLNELLTAFNILTVSTTTTKTPNWYDILNIEPFSHINVIKKKYKKLALALHPDKNTCVASEDAFKIVNEAFGVLNDKIRRKEYDMRLRIDMQAAAVTAVESGGGAECSVGVEMFWTVCSGCKVSREFERRYLGHSLMCPSCKKSFEAVEVDIGDDDEIIGRSDLKRKMSSVGDIMKRSEKSKKSDGARNGDGGKRLRVVNKAAVRKSERLKENGKVVDDDEEMMTLADMRKLVNVNDDDEDDEEDEDMTLAEMQKLGNNDDDDEETMTLADMQKHLNDDEDDVDEEEEEEENMTLAEMQKLVKINVNVRKLKVNEKDKARRSGATSSDLKNKTNGEGKNQNSDIMTVEDSDFYDFDEGRVEKSFKKGQIWALYDDDGLPRHYGLIDEVVSTHPFEVNMSWLDPQINSDDTLLSLERTGFSISCGRFKVSKKTLVTSLNVFSHVVNCERAAREVYRIYPKKGSVWALYSEHGERGGQIAHDKTRFDIVVFLTSYSEVHGLSMAYLEKVKGYKTTFRRREIGCHAIKWLEKHEAWLFSHQIPARKLSGEEVLDLSGDYWELDPAALPTDLISTNRKK